MAQKTKAEFDAMIAAARAQRAAFRAAILAHGERPFEAKTQWGTVFVSKDPRTPARPWRISFFGASGGKPRAVGHVELRSFLEAIDELPAYGVNNVSQINLGPKWSLNPMKNPFVHPGVPEDDLAAFKGEVSTLIKISMMTEDERRAALQYVSSVVNTLRAPRSEIAATRSLEYDVPQIVSRVDARERPAVTAAARRLARRAVEKGVIGHYPTGPYFDEPPDAAASRAARAEVAKQAAEAEKKRLLEELKEERRLRSLTAKRAPTDKAAAKARAKLLEIEEVPHLPAIDAAREEKYEVMKRAKQIEVGQPWFSSSPDEPSREFVEKVRAEYERLYANKGRTARLPAYEQLLSDPLLYETSLVPLWRFGLDAPRIAQHLAYDLFPWRERAALTEEGMQAHRLQADREHGPQSYADAERASAAKRASTIDVGEATPGGRRIRLYGEARTLVAQNNLGKYESVKDRQSVYDAVARAESRARELRTGRPGVPPRESSAAMVQEVADRLREIADELGELEHPSKPWGSEKSEIARRMAHLELNPRGARRQKGLSGEPRQGAITYSMPEERIGPVQMNPAGAFHDVFGVPYEAHLVPVWPKKRRANGPVLSTPEQVAEYIGGISDSPQERYLAILLDSKGAVIGVVTVSVGILNAAIVEPRETFAAALAARAAAIVCVHNHPSGDPTPSREDILCTQQLVNAGHLLRINVLDHIVIGRREGGKQRFTSLATIGKMPTPQECARSMTFAGPNWKKPEQGDAQDEIARRARGIELNPKPMPDWRKKACDDRCDVLVDMARKSGVIEKIERRFGVTLGRDYLDCGARACVWDLGDKVLKLTDDADDASTASYIKRFRDQLPEGDRDALAEVFEACMIEGRGGARRFWVVLAEKLDPVDDDEAQALSDLHKMSRMGFRDIMSPGTANAFPTPGGQKALLAWRALGRLYEQGVNVSKDAHNRNWGRDAKGRLKLFDFGASGVPSFGGSAPECVLK